MFSWEFFRRCGGQITFHIIEVVEVFDGRELHRPQERLQFKCWWNYYDSSFTMSSMKVHGRSCLSKSISDTGNVELRALARSINWSLIQILSNQRSCPERPVLPVMSNGSTQWYGCMASGKMFSE